MRKRLSTITAALFAYSVFALIMSVGPAVACYRVNQYYDVNEYYPAFAAFFWSFAVAALIDAVFKGKPSRA